jgi:branched-subunit amino acid permease
VTGCIWNPQKVLDIVIPVISMSYDIMFHMTGINLIYDRIKFSNQTYFSILSNGYMFSIRISKIYNESFQSWEFILALELYGVQENYGI